MSRTKPKAPLGVAAVIAGIVVAAVVMVPGTLSNFVSSKQTAAATVSTGQAALTITGSGGGSTNGVYPGGPAELLATRTVTNGGDVSLSLSGALGASGTLGSAVTITVSAQTTACAATPPTSWAAGTGVWQGKTSGLTTATAVTLAPGASRTLCVWQSLDTSAPAATQGQSAPVSVTLTGTQTTP